MLWNTETVVTGGIPEPFIKKAPGRGQSYIAMIFVGFPGAGDKALLVNICTGAHIAVAAGLTCQYDVIVFCALRIGFFIKRLICFTFSGEVMIDVNNA